MNAIKWTITIFVFTIQNEPKGKLIVDVNAKYNGKSDEQDFRFSIIHGNAKVFQINEENGKITTLKPLDREIASKYIVS